MDKYHTDYVEPSIREAVDRACGIAPKPEPDTESQEVTEARLFRQLLTGELSRDDYNRLMTEALSREAARERANSTVGGPMRQELVRDENITEVLPR